jgi:hypothetical protein
MIWKMCDHRGRLGTVKGCLWYDIKVIPSVKGLLLYSTRDKVVEYRAQLKMKLFLGVVSNESKLAIIYGPLMCLQLP